MRNNYRGVQALLLQILLLRPISCCVEGATLPRIEKSYLSFAPFWEQILEAGGWENEGGRETHFSCLIRKQLHQYRRQGGTPLFCLSLPPLPSSTVPSRRALLYGVVFFIQFQAAYRLLC